LIAAALQAAPPMTFPREGSARERIVGAFEMLEGFLSGTHYRGCPFIIYAAELTDPKHPARTPEILSEQLDVLFDGGLASGAKRGELKPVRAACAAARILLEDATSQAPRSVRRNSSQR